MATDWKHKQPSKCIIYWDYQNMPIQKEWLINFDINHIINILKNTISKKIGNSIPISLKAYTTNDNPICNEIQYKFDTSGIEVIYSNNCKPECVDKRIILDCSLMLYKLEKNKERNAICLITGNKDFGLLLSRIHHEPPISHLFLINFATSDQSVDGCLKNNVDAVLNHFDFVKNLENKDEIGSNLKFVDIDGDNVESTPDTESKTNNGSLNRSYDELQSDELESDESKEIMINIKCDNGKVQKLNVKKSEIISNIISRMQYENNIYIPKTIINNSSPNQLWFKDILLQKDKTLIDYDIRSNSQLRFSNSSTASIPPIEPETCTTRQIDVDIINTATPSMTAQHFKFNDNINIATIKSNISSHTGTPKNQQKLLFLNENDCFELKDDEKTLKDYHIKLDDNNNIKLYVSNLCLISIFPIIIKKLDGSMFILTVEGDTVIFNVKSAIKHKTEIEEKRQKLFFNGKVLNDKERIDECGIINMSVIYLKIKTKAKKLSSFTPKVKPKRIMTKASKFDHCWRNSKQNIENDNESNNQYQNNQYKNHQYESCENNKYSMKREWRAKKEINDKQEEKYSVIRVVLNTNGNCNQNRWKTNDRMKSEENENKRIGHETPPSPSSLSPSSPSPASPSPSDKSSKSDSSNNEFEVNKNKVDNDYINQTLNNIKKENNNGDQTQRSPQTPSSPSEETSTSDKSMSDKSIKDKENKDDSIKQDRFVYNATSPELEPEEFDQDDNVFSCSRPATPPPPSPPPVGPLTAIRNIQDECQFIYSSLSRKGNVHWRNSRISTTKAQTYGDFRNEKLPVTPESSDGD